MSDWQRQLDEDFNWRSAELALLKIQAFKSPRGSAHRRALIRTLWVMLYAHYEGYVKATWDLFLAAIQNERVPCGELIDGLAAIVLKSQIKQIQSNFSIQQTYAFMVNDLGDILRTIGTFEDSYEKISSLPPEKYCAICNDFGLSTAAAEKHKTKLGSLVKMRHQIAHGQNLWSDILEDYTDYENVALEVMTDLAVSVIDVLEKQTYRKMGLVPSTGMSVV